MQLKTNPTSTSNKSNLNVLKPSVNTMTFENPLGTRSNSTSFVANMPRFRNTLIQRSQ